MFRRRRILRPVRPVPLGRRRVRWLPGCILPVAGVALILLIVAAVFL
jgi:hypothetical protein